MSNANTLTPFKTNWAEFDAMTDADIDFSDIPEQGPEFFAKARLLLPGQRSSEATPRNAPASERKPVTVQLEIDPVLLAWFQTQGEDYQQKMRDALLQYAKAHQTT